MARGVGRTRGCVPDVLPVAPGPERRALAGELSVLEWIWRHEETLADLADSLGTPTGLDDQVEALRRPG